MNSVNENEVSEGKGNIKDRLFFIEDSITSESGEEACSGSMKHEKRAKLFPQLSRDSSPPLLLAFAITSGKTQQDTSSVSSAGSQEQLAEDSDQPIEEWMILDGEEQAEDPSIQLNLGCWESCEEDVEDEGMTDKKVESGGDSWAVSDKDKIFQYVQYGGTRSLGSRYFRAGRPSICNICNKMGHVARSCYFHKKSPTCVLCGVQGHVQRDCPSRPCSTCGLPSHALSPCRVAPVWKQHCQRCGVTGHMFHACPDTWRQYHLTVKLGVPFRPRNACSLKYKSHLAHCYNCSKRGHYGHECTKRRMISGTFPSLPYVCYYDTLDDILQQNSPTLTPAKDLASAGPLTPSQQECCKDTSLMQGRSRTKLEPGAHPGRRRTWPERRRERREVKRLRREAQAKREGGFLGRHFCTIDDSVCPADPYRPNLRSHGESKTSQENKKREEKAGRKSRKSREAEKWRKRGGIKRGDLHPHSDIDIGSENLLSPKQRVRHRRR